MKKVDLNTARFGDVFLDHDGRKLIYNQKKKGYHELLEESTHRLMPYTDDGWFRWNFSGFQKSELTRKIPVEKRSPLTTRIVYVDDSIGLMQIHREYHLAFAKEIERLEKEMKDTKNA